MNKINISRRGGASFGLGYAPNNKEIFKKDIRIKLFAGASAGAVDGAVLGISRTFDEHRSYYLKFPGDAVMRREASLERGFVERTVSPIRSFFRAIGVVAGLRGDTQDKIQAYFKRYLSWAKVKEVGRIEKLFQCYVPMELIGNYGGNRYTLIDLVRMVRSNRKPFSLISREIFPMYGSDDGQYIYSAVERRMVKVSDTVVPLDLLTFSAFWNPVFRMVSFTIKLYDDACRKYFGHLGRLVKGGKLVVHPFDGGIVNNEANLPQSYIGPDFYQQICDVPGTEPDKGHPSDGKMHYSDQFYDFFRPSPGKVQYFPPKDLKLAFFEFDDATVMSEYDVTESDVFH